MKRDTATGSVLEGMVLPALERCGYECRRHVVVGDRLGCGRHIVDLVATKDDVSVLVSLKWQQVAGIAEQKVPFEVMCLLDAVAKGPYSKAYLVLGGEGWKLRQLYVSGGLSRFLLDPVSVEILTLEGFVARATRGSL